MSTPDRPTCGKGLAENSALPAKLGELIGSMAANLEAHLPALDLQDANSKQEFEAYRKLIGEQREIAARLAVTAQEMAGYRDLPMGRHDEKAMIHPRIREAFEKFVQSKQELLTLLEQTTQRDDQLLTVMRSHTG